MLAKCPGSDTMKPGRMLPVLLGMAGTAVFTAAANGQATGQAIFEGKCGACHRIGGGILVGPDLKGVDTLRPREWLRRWIAAPEKMLASRDPVAMQLLREFHDVPMPNMGLAATEVDSVIAYIASASSGAVPAAVAAAPLPAGDGDRGRDLFLGTMRFEDGGPSCMGCHSVAGIGALGGGQLGPDLTTVATRYGGAPGLAAFLTGMPTPTMNAVWSARPPSATERADLVAFLTQAPVSERPVGMIWRLGLLALLGLVLLLALAGWLWRGRLRGVRMPMVAAQRPARR